MYISSSSSEDDSSELETYTISSDSSSHNEDTNDIETWTISSATSSPSYSSCNASDSKEDSVEPFDIEEEGHDWFERSISRLIWESANEDSDVTVEGDVNQNDRTKPKTSSKKGVAESKVPDSISKSGSGVSSDLQSRESRKRSYADIQQSANSNNDAEITGYGELKQINRNKPKRLCTRGDVRTPSNCDTSNGNGYFEQGLAWMVKNLPYLNNNKSSPENKGARQPYQCAHCGHKTYHFSRLKHHILDHIETSSTPKEIQEIVDPTRTTTKICIKEEPEHQGLEGIVNSGCSGVVIKMEMDISDEEFGKVYTCYHCRWKTDRLDKLRRHIVRRHLRQELYFCRFCLFQSYDKNGLRRHLSECRVKKKRFSCGICGYKGNELRCLEKHMENRHSLGKEYRCRFCEFSTTERWRLRKHKCTKVSGEFKCGKCNKNLATKDSLKQHLQRVHLKVKNFSCSLCSFKGATKESVLVHTKGVHLNEKKYICYHCGFRGMRLVHLQDHIKSVHLKFRSYPCTECNYIAMTKRNLNQHLQIHDSPKFKCMECNYSAKRKDHLRNHIAVYHLTNKPYFCEKCDSKFPTKPKLNQHILYKHTKKSFPCTECDYVARLKHLLKEHTMAKHTNERPFSCSLCDFKTVNRKNLNNHINSRHSKRKPFSCEYCSYRASRKQHLKLHCLSRHSDSRPHVCPYCDYSSVQDSHLKRHLRTQHPNSKLAKRDS